MNLLKKGTRMCCLIRFSFLVNADLMAFVNVDLAYDSFSFFFFISRPVETPHHLSLRNNCLTRLDPLSVRSFVRPLLRPLSTFVIQFGNNVLSSL